ncbi:DUF6345 domain-containing protein [Nonomuraea sp. NPDC050556]|uniref:DUF6345 domain-containing protein n=1 Tax=Nonomuraea sp. NPDC050556 TaxID=3364369 RepID=UPI00379D6192
MDTLPIFRAVRVPTTTQDTIELAKKLFGIDPVSLERRGRRIVLRSGQHVVEADVEGAGVWAADEARMWNPRIPPPDIPDADTALSAAANHVEKLLPQLGADQPFAYGAPFATRTVIARWNAQDGRQDYPYDITVNYPITVNVKDGKDRIPFVGGGGSFNLVFGERARLIGFSGAWRRTAFVREAELVPLHEADKEFRILIRELEFSAVSVSLAYYAGPAFTDQKFIFPVYVCSATVRVDGNDFKMQEILLPATKEGRSGGHHIIDPPHDPTRFARAVGDLSSTADQQEPKPPARVRDDGIADDKPYKCGAWWYGGKPAVTENLKLSAEGLLHVLNSAGWHITVANAEDKAKKSQWLEDADKWVDAVDFAYFNGHASPKGWVMAGGNVSFDTKPHRPAWGSQDVEWIGINGCGPLQDDILFRDTDIVAPCTKVSGYDALDKWKGVFDGLHMLLGFASQIMSSEFAGLRFAEYAAEGQFVLTAWLRMGREIQATHNDKCPPDGPIRWVGAVWPEETGANPVDDHLWGFGSVSADPVLRNAFVAMWTSC